MSSARSPRRFERAANAPPGNQEQRPDLKMRGVPHMPSRLALYLLLQKPLKPRGKPALVSPCGNLPDCLAVGAVRRKPLCGKFREDPGSSGMGAGFQRAITCFIWSQNPGEKPGKICPENGACSGDAKSISAGRGMGLARPLQTAPRARKGRTRCTMSLRGIGSRGPGGLSTGALTGRVKAIPAVRDI